jgi:hypothetical protein
MIRLASDCIDKDIAGPQIFFAANLDQASWNPTTTYAKLVAGTRPAARGSYPTAHCVSEIVGG